jgi:hypothetical protein
VSNAFRRRGRRLDGGRSRSHLEDLDDWYDDASSTIENLDTCLSIIRSMLTGSPESNLRIAQSLSGLLLDAELWLLTHPCPDKWNGEYMLDVVGVFVEIGQEIVQADGDAMATPGDLGQEIDVAVDLVANLRDLAHQVAQAVRG